MDPSRRPQLVPTGWPAVDAVLHSSDPTELGQAELHPTGWGGLVRGAVHEWYGVGPASKGWSPPLFLLTHLARQAVADALDRGVPDHVVWIGRNVWPYPRTLSHPVDVEVVGQAQYRPRLEASIALSEPEDAELKSSGSAAGRDLLMRSLFVATTTGRSSKGESSERLWAIDTALRCPSVTAVVADGSGLPMAATRRLQLAAASAGALVLLARPPEEVREISAATTRWTVTREAVPDTGVPPPGPCWRLALMRAKGAQKVIHRKIVTVPPLSSRCTKTAGHSHAARPRTPPTFILDRPLPTSPPPRDAPARCPEDVVPPLDTNERRARLHRAALQ